MLSRDMSSPIFTSAVISSRFIPGRHFQSVGANPPAAWIAGIRVNVYVAFAYACTGVLYGLAGILLA
ncbi:MAG TPA: hypothetical protein VJZ27_10560, partial [Aggregatilineales bacterium]|nr:hypothetical protein [Aggregatilineales bacterium]